MTALELAEAKWRKSSRSNGQGQCVEVALADNIVAVRDSKNPTGAVLNFAAAEWAAFIEAAKAGVFNL